MSRAVGTIFHSADPGWGPEMLALAESLSTREAYLYRCDAQEKRLRLLSQSSADHSAPAALAAGEGVLSEILADQKLFSNETRKFGEALSGFRAPHLTVSPLSFSGKILGLLIVGTQATPSRVELDFVSEKAVHFSLLLALEAAETEKEAIQKRACDLEAKLSAAYVRLQESDKLATLGTFAGGLAHEFNTPLAAVQTYAEFLQFFVKGESEQESLEGILKAVAHCKEIVENVLRLSRKGHREFEPIVLRHVIHDALVLTEPEMEKLKISAGSEVVCNPIVMGNHTRLVQVVTNLLNNARDSMRQSRLLPRKGGVKVTLGCDDTMAHIEVLDNGPGIPKKILGQVFNPFFTTKDVGQGTGLGLSICHTIVQEHSGTLEILSEEGQGTRVLVKLPLLDRKGS